MIKCKLIYIRCFFEPFVARMEVIMEFKKCCRCGVFFASSNSVCSHCQAKDEQDLYKLNTFMNENGIPVSVSNLSAGTVHYILDYIF